MSEKKGFLFNIQKFSVNDGPGIRTVVFFKGCPLKCRWCSNPESQNLNYQLLRDQKKCSLCQTCISECDNNALEVKNNIIALNHQLCNGCRKCVLKCPNNALEVEGYYKTVDEVMDIVLQDKVFYEESGGGLTLSGGEFLNQSDFSLALLEKAKEKKINTCCETTGFASTAIFSSVIKNIDFILFDLKHWDNKKHIEGTGVSNMQILKNLEYAVKQKKDILVRIPVIPYFNDRLEDAKEFAKLINSLGLKRCQILPFHQFGENKYNLLNKEYAYHDEKSLHAEDLYDFKQVLIDSNIDAFF